MLRSLLRPARRAARTSNVYTKSRRSNGTYGSPPVYSSHLRVIGPTSWCIATVGVVVLGCAGWEVYGEAQEAQRHHARFSKSSSATYEQLESIRRSTWAHDRYKPSLQHMPSASWSSLPDADKMIAGAMGLNTAIFAMTRTVPGLYGHFSHIPAASLNYTLLSSVFGHGSMLHLGLNMFALYNFAPQVARSRLFESSTAHLTAFYLSTGILTSLAHHLTSKFASPRSFPPAFVVPGLGASGAIFAILGAWAVMFPEARLGMLFIPGSLPADQALAGIALFETYGFLVGFKSINFSHAAHLSGLVIGSSYAYFDGKRRIWQPARRIAFQQMKFLGLV